MLDLFNVLDNPATPCSSGNYACGGVIGAGIPGNIANMVHYLYLAIQIIVPVLLIIFGMIELAKAITAQKEDEIKKAQAGLLKKAVVAILVFLVFSLVKFVFYFATSGTDADNVWTCVDTLISGKGCDSDKVASDR